MSEDTPSLEKQLLTWAEEHNYPYKERLWSYERREQIDPDITTKEEGLLDRMAHFMSCDLHPYTRTIYIPNGLITYAPHLHRTETQQHPRNDEELTALLSGEPLQTHTVEWWLGEYNPDWEKDFWEEEQRRADAFLHAHFPYSIKRGMSHQSTITLAHNEHTDNPLYAMLATVLRWDKLSERMLLRGFGPADSDRAREFFIPSVGSLNGDLRRSLTLLDTIISSAQPPGDVY